MSDGPTRVKREPEEKMDVDSSGTEKGKGPELKIRGQADVGKKRARSDEPARDEVSMVFYVDSNKLIIYSTQAIGDEGELQRRENELKERALRNKVVRTRKSGSASGSGTGTGGSSS